MKKAPGKIALLMVSLGLTFAVVAAADNLVPIPALNARVTDSTHTLDAQQQQSLTEELAALEQRKGAQVAVLIVPTTKPEEIEQYSIRVVDQWKLGRKKVDDGVLLIVAKNDHRVRIEVGQGLEGAIPDATASRIINEYVTPKFRSGDFYGGIHDATGALGKLIDGEALPEPLADSPDAHGRNFPNGLIFGLFALVWARGFFTFLPPAARSVFVAAAAGTAGWFASAGIVPLIVLLGVIGVILGWIGGSGTGGSASGGGGGWSSGGWSGSSSSDSGGGFSGGGGGFSGGGASGSW